MLKGLDPILDADTLHALRAMGHGDMLILADTNFPAAALARETVLGRPLRIEQPLARVAQAVLSVLPLDGFVEDFAARMQVVDAPDTVPEVQAEIQTAIAATGEARSMVGVDRFAFYDMARQAYAILQTGERRFYGCVMLRKGVVGPDA